MSVVSLFSDGSGWNENKRKFVDYAKVFVQ